MNYYLEVNEKKHSHIYLLLISLLLYYLQVEQKRNLYYYTILLAKS